MYLRFEPQFRDSDSRCQTGIFGAGHVARYERPDLTNDWHLTEINRISNRFKRNLDAPDRFIFQSGRRSRINGACWFRSDAQRHIRQARYMAWLLTDFGLFISERRSGNPGRIVWEDRKQIVSVRHAE